MQESVTLDFPTFTHVSGSMTWNMHWHLFHSVLTYISDIRDRVPGEGNGNPIQDFCLKDPVDRGAWWATVLGVSKELDPIERLTHKGHS